MFLLVFYAKLSALHIPVKILLTSIKWIRLRKHLTQSCLEPGSYITSRPVELSKNIAGGEENHCLRPPFLQ